MDGHLVAWESGNVMWNDFAHGFGEFLTSPGLGGLCVLGGAIIAATQVRETREADKLAATAALQVQKDENTATEEARRADRGVLEASKEAENRARRIDQLWSRFVWATTNQTSDILPSVARTATILAIYEEAQRVNDDSLLAATRSFFESVLKDDIAPRLVDVDADQVDNGGEPEKRT